MNAIAIAHKLALSYNRTTGIEVEELVSEAYLEYLIWEPQYNPEKSAKSTFAWMVMEGKMKDMAARAKKAPIADSDFIDTCSTAIGNPETRYLFIDSLKELSADAFEVCQMIFEAPMDFIQDTPRASRKTLADFLRNEGWTFIRIENVIRELKHFLA